MNLRGSSGGTLGSRLSWQLHGQPIKLQAPVEMLIKAQVTAVPRPLERTCCPAAERLGVVYVSTGFLRVEVVPSAE